METQFATRDPIKELVEKIQTASSVQTHETPETVSLSPKEELCCNAATD